jgi:menaquinone-dependent protoporphyrinogen oxidase
MVNARGHRTFAGALDRTTLNGARLGFAERLVAKTLIPQGDYRDWTAIDDWAAGIARELAGSRRGGPEAKPGSLGGRAQRTPETGISSVE